MQTLDSPLLISANRSSVFYIATRHLFDYLLALIAFVFSMPVLLIACLAVVLETPGSPVFTQTRIGSGGRRFRMYKIRTMQINTDRFSYVTKQNDARITRVGGFLRATKLDELPQLVNIIRGHMSVIGPRPLSEVECAQLRQLGFDDDFPGFIPIGRPGLIGLEQVNRHFKLDYADRFRLNAIYESNRSWWLDLQIIFRAIVLCKVVVGCVLFGLLFELFFLSAVNGASYLR